MSVRGGARLSLMRWGLVTAAARLDPTHRAVTADRTLDAPADGLIDMDDVVTLRVDLEGASVLCRMDVLAGELDRVERIGIASLGVVAGRISRGSSGTYDRERHGSGGDQESAFALRVVKHLHRPEPRFRRVLRPLQRHNGVPLGVSVAAR